MTDRQAKFCREYLKDLNATQAAVRAGYAPKYANRIGSANLKKKEISDYLDQRRKKTEEKDVAQASEVLRYFTMLMRGDIYEQHIEQDQQSREEAVLRQPVKVADRTKAAEFLAKYYRVLSGEKEEAQESGGRICVELKGELKEWSK